MSETVDPMMKARTLACLAAVLGLAACEPLQWEHPQYGTTRLEADLADCDHIALANSYRFGPADPMLTAPHVYRLPGGQVVADPVPTRSYSSYSNLGELRSFCMRSKGYELTPVGEAK